MGRMDGCIEGRTHEWKGAWMERCLVGFKGGRMNMCIDGRMNR